MLVYRTIFRLDFLRNYAMINQPGTVAQIIDEAVRNKEFFDFFGEDRAARRILVKRHSKEPVRFRSLSVEPTAIVCDLEMGDGTPLRNLVDDSEFLTLCSIASSLLKEFGITKLERAGIRFFMFGSEAGSVRAAVKTFRSLVRNDFLDLMEGTLGKVTDVGIAADGMDEGKVGYKFKAGPFVGAEEYPKYFTNINDLLPKDPDLNTVIDLDVYENKFSYGFSNVIKWCAPQIAVASKIAERVSELVAKEAGK